MDCVGNPNLRGGFAIVHIVSETFTRRDLKLNVTSYDTRTEFAQAAATGRGFTLAERNSYVEFELPDGADVSLDEIASICNSTVTVRLPNGKAYTWTNAWLASEDFGIASDQGNIPLRFESGEQAEEVLP